MAEDQKIRELMAQLSTNEILRRQYNAYPDKVCKAFGLSDEETTQFLQLSKDLPQVGAERIVTMRLKAARHFIPGVCRLLGEDLQSKFAMYCERFPVVEPQRGTFEALQFLEFLTAYSDYPIPGYPYANEVIDYERTRLELLLAPPAAQHFDADTATQIMRSSGWKKYKPKVHVQFFVKSYNYPIDRIIHNLIAGEKVLAEPDVYWILFARRQHRAEVLARRIKKSTHLLLQRCDGRSVIGDIIPEVRQELKLKLQEHAQFEKECRAFLLRLAREGYLELERPPEEQDNTT